MRIMLNQWDVFIMMAESSALEITVGKLRHRRCDAVKIGVMKGWRLLSIGQDTHLWDVQHDNTKVAKSWLFICCTELGISVICSISLALLQHFTGAGALPLPGKASEGQGDEVQQCDETQEQFPFYKAKSPGNTHQMMACRLWGQ